MPGGSGDMTPPLSTGRHDCSRSRGIVTSGLPPGERSAPGQRDRVVSHIDLQVDSYRLVVGSAGQASAHTYVTYRATSATVRVRLQSRIGTTAPWGNVPLPLVMLDPDGSLPKDYRQAGRFRTPELRPGEVYQVRALVEGSDSAVEGLQTVLVMTRDLSLKDRVAA
jgi:hypothetical protein